MKFLPCSRRARRSCVFAVIACATGLHAPQLACAAALVEESFSYATGSVLAGQGGGTGFSGAWSSVNSPDAAPDTIQGETLRYGDLASYGGSVRTFASDAQNLSGTFDSWEQRTVTAGLLPLTTGSTLWFSFLVRLDAVGDGSPGTAGVRISPTSGSSLFFGARWNGQSGVYGVSGGTPTANSTIAYQLGQTAFIVLAITFNTSSTNERIRLFVNPDLQVAEPLLADAELTTFNLGSIARMSVVSSANDRTWTMDEVRAGVTYRDVAPLVPEPSGAAFATGAGGLLLGIRGRRSRAGTR